MAMVESGIQDPDPDGTLIRKRIYSKSVLLRIRIQAKRIQYQENPKNLIKRSVPMNYVLILLNYHFLYLNNHVN